MGLKALFTGNVTCDWCGCHIKSLENDGSLLGLVFYGSLIANIFYGVKKNYCSTACKIAAKKAKE